MATKTAHRPAPDEAPSCPIPDWVEDFGEDESFRESPELAALGAHLIAKWPELHWLREFRIRYLWKAEGGESRGRATFGKCTLANAMLKHFAKCDWVIWLAADHCGNAEFTDSQVEALLYHELLHPRLGGREMDTPAMRAHDEEVFFGEIRRYGTWETGLETLYAVLAKAKGVA